MFDNIPFWKSWPSSSRRWYLFLLILFAVSLIGYFWAYFAGNAMAIDWDVMSTVHSQQVLFDEFFTGIQKTSVYVEQFIIEQNFEAEPLQLYPAMGSVFIGIVCVVILILYAFATTISRFWFVVSSGILLVILVALRLENLLLFDQFDKTGLIACMTVLLLLGYYFNAFKQEASLTVRVVAILLAGMVLAIAFSFLSKAPFPAFQIANYGILVPLGLTIFFALLVGHEVLSGALNLITNYNKVGEKNSLLHFLVFSLVYLANAILVYLYNRRIIEWEVTLLDAFWLLAINAIVGIWGFRQREVNYQYIFKFRSIGAFTYLLLAIISFLTIIFFFVSSNDPMLEVIEDAIIFSQIGYSTFFFFYIITNFIQLLKDNKQVSKVMYKPMRMPYFTSRLAGTITVAALFFVSDMLPYQQGIVGYLIGLGDLYKVQDEELVAEEYYKQAAGLGKLSHRANYALASMAHEQGSRNKELQYLAQAIEKHPSPFAMANLGMRYLDKGKFFDGMFILRNGVTLFPESGQLHNNLAMAFSTTDITDSAYYHLELAKEAGRKTENEALTNMLGLFAKKDYVFEKDTLPYLWQEDDNIAYRSNVLTFGNKNRTIVDSTQSYSFGDPNDMAPDQLIFNYNLVLNNTGLVDSSYWNQLDEYYKSGNSNWMEESLNFAGAMASYKNGSSSKPVGVLINLVNQEGSRAPIYAYMLGNIALSYDAPLLAAEYYEKSVRQGLERALPGWAFALLEAGKTEQAMDIWRRIVQAKAEGAEMGQRLLDIYMVNDIEQVASGSDQDKYLFLRYFSRLWPRDMLEGLILTMQDDNIKAASYVYFARKAYKNNDLETSEKLLVQAEACQFNKDYVYEPYLKTLLLVKFKEGDNVLLPDIANEIREKYPKLKSYAQLADIKILELKGDIDGAFAKYKQLAHDNALITEVVSTAASHARLMNANKEQAYQILLDALTLNPYDIALNKAYVMQAVELGLHAYARETMEEMADFASEAYESFLPEYEDALELYDPANNWNE